MFRTMKKWFRNLLKGISLTGALFVFQACYGTPQPPELEEDTQVEAVADEAAPAEAEAQTVVAE